MQREEMKEKRQIVIWPLYLDSGRTRKDGRLAPEAASVKSPRTSEIFKAAQKLGMNPEMVTGKAHPATWSDRSGMVLVDNLGPKSDIVRRVGTEIIRMRGGKQ
ncbi:MAG TPA: signal recognition particle subunit SRP19/SEC65 family protein [Methanocella sp.]|nr:signal recognition particle subunit SRP19/SEC65 family protein [Methanocella sp.]